MCLSTHTFLLLVNILLTSLLPISMWKFAPTQLGGQGLPLATGSGGLVARTLLSQPWPDYSLWLGTEALLQAAVGCGNLTSVFLPFSYTYPCSLIEVLAQFCICRSWLLTSTVLIIVHLLYTPILQLGKLKPCVWNSKRFCVRRSWLKFWFL